MPGSKHPFFRYFSGQYPVFFLAWGSGRPLTRLFLSRFWETKCPERFGLFHVKQHAF
jgi:hypothetical protein